MNKFKNFKDAINYATDKLKNESYNVHTEKWQAKDIKDDPKFTMIETLNTSFSCDIDPNIDVLKEQIKPNVAWADEHIQERLSGIPHNPPPSHVRWPYAQKNNAEFGGLEKFSHTYPERIWPKYRNVASDGTILDEEPIMGFRYRYGDFNDVVELMYREPLTRQAYLPLWFPEDTGAVEGQRVPCTLGYHFMMRDNKLHVVYGIRSCDFFRHFRDDIYLCARKLLWLLDRLREKDPATWNNVVPGTLTMHITSLHIWALEKPLLDLRRDI